LDAAPGSGGIPRAIFVSIDPSGLGPGSYSGSVTVQTDGPPARSQVIPVTVTVTTTGRSCGVVSQN
jgi:hypothetical protein